MIGAITTIIAALTIIAFFFWLGMNVGVWLVREHYRKDYEWRLAVRNDPARTIYYTEQARNLARTEQAIVDEHGKESLLYDENTISRC
jgi:hypothetical protein